jgi:uncharacterized OB-fold protein
MSTPYQDRPLKDPIVDPVTEPYWTAASQGVLRLRKCTACGKPHFYPRPVCPHCMGDTEWADASGKGTVYSISVTRRAGPIPFAIAYVTLDEGVTMLTNIVDCDLDSVKIGDRVRVVFKPTPNGGKLPMLAPEA